MRTSQVIGQLTAGLAVAAVLVAATPSVVQANSDDYTAQPVRYWPTGASFQAEGLGVDGHLEGTTLIWGAREDEEGADEDCRIAIADRRRVLSHSYRHDFSPTGCVDAVAHPQGGLFVRGETGPAPGDWTEGTTTRIDADGEVVWSIDDSAFRQREGHPEGPGQFQGDYGGPVAGIAYDEAGDDLVVLAVGDESLADDRTNRVVQAQVVDASDGSVELVGRSFGTFGDENIVDAVARDGEFLLVTRREDGGAPGFYSFRADGAVQGFEPEDTDWSSRRVVGPVQYHPELGTFVVWEAADEDDPTVGVVRVEGLDSVVFSEQFDPAEVVGVGEVQNLRPVRMWVDDRRVALLYRGPGLSEYLHLLDAQDGTRRGIVRWREQMEYSPVGMSRDADGALTALALEHGGDVIWEYAVGPEDDIDRPPPEVTDEHEDDQGCMAGGSNRPVGAAIAAVVLIVVAVRRDQGGLIAKFRGAA